MKRGEFRLGRGGGGGVGWGGVGRASKGPVLDPNISSSREDFIMLCPHKSLMVVVRYIPLPPSL